eukprot:6949293-Pyramimonas_sp.AAC.2
MEPLTTLYGPPYNPLWTKISPAHASVRCNGCTVALAEQPAERQTSGLTSRASPSGRDEFQPFVRGDHRRSDPAVGRSRQVRLYVAGRVTLMAGLRCWQGYVNGRVTSPIG